LRPLAPQVSRLKSRPPRVKALKDSEELKLLGERGGLRRRFAPGMSHEKWAIFHEKILGNI